MIPPLPLERYAAIHAAMTSGQPRDEALEAAQVSAESWDATQTFWLMRMGADAKKNRFALMNRFTTLVAAETAKLERAREAARADRFARRTKARAARPWSAPSARAAPLSAVTAEPIGGGALSAPPPAQTTPPAAPSRPTAPPVAYVPKLTVEQLATLRAELVTVPEPEHAAVRARFGLDEAVWPLEEAEWQQRFAADKALFAKYVQQFQYYRALLRPRG